MVYPTNWHCAGTLVTTVLTEDCTVTATSTDTVSLSVYAQQVTYGDWIFLNMWLVFFLVLIVVGQFLSHTYRGSSLK